MDLWYIIEFVTAVSGIFILFIIFSLKREINIHTPEPEIKVCKNCNHCWLNEDSSIKCTYRPNTQDVCLLLPPATPTQ